MLERVPTQKHSHRAAKQRMLTLVRRGARQLPTKTPPYFLPSQAAQTRALGILLPYHPNENLTGSEDAVDIHNIANTSSVFDLTSSNPSAPFLEEISEEYGYSDRVILTRRRNLALLDAVRLSNLAEAERIRETLIESGLPITPNVGYAAVVLSILRRLVDPNASVEKEGAVGVSTREPVSFDLVAGWLDLIPSVHSEMRLTDSVVREICSSLESPNICIAHARRGALLLASKGYTKDLKNIIPRIVRFSIPTHSQQFIESVDAYDVQYHGAGNNKAWEDKHVPVALGSRADAAPILPGVNLKGNTRRRIARRWALAIRTHALAGRPEEAAQLLLHVLKFLPKEIGVFTYFVSLAGVRSAHGASGGHENYASDIWCRAAENLTSGELGILERLLAPSSTSSRGRLSGIHRGWHSDKPTHHALRSLGTASSPLPSVRTLATWMKAYRDGGRQNLMRLLVRRWSRSASLARRSGHEGHHLPRSYASERLFGTAEMYLALSEGKPLEVIKAFMAYFSLEGVPGRRFIERIAHAAPGISTVGDTSRLSPLLGCDVLQGRASRLTPSPHAIAILVHALLLPVGRQLPRRLRKRLAIDEKAKALELYSDVLAMFTSGTPASEPDGTTESPSSAFENIPPAILPDPVIFQAFLSSPQFQSENELAGILADMTRLGVQPSRNNWTAVIGLFAKKGDERAVLKLLTSMEQGHLSQKGGERLMPSPDAVTYIAAIQGALVNGDVGLAERVFKKFAIWRMTNGNSWGAFGKTRDVIEYLEQKLADAKRKMGLRSMKRG